MTTVTRLYHFSASHRLHIPELTEQENYALYGKCNNPYGHGHDYTLEVTAAGPVDEQTGVLLFREDLDRLVRECVLSQFDGRNINLDVPDFAAGLVPTTENIALVISRELEKNWPVYLGDSLSTLYRIHIQETGRNGFELFVSKPHSSRTARPYAGDIIVHA